MKIWLQSRYCSSVHSACSTGWFLRAHTHRFNDVTISSTISGWRVGNGENARSSSLARIDATSASHEWDSSRRICRSGASCLMRSTKRLNTVSPSSAAKPILSVPVATAGSKLSASPSLMDDHRSSMSRIFGPSSSARGVGVRPCGTRIKSGSSKISRRRPSECETAGAVMCIFSATYVAFRLLSSSVKITSSLVSTFTMIRPGQFFTCFVDGPTTCTGCTSDVNRFF